MQAFPRLELQRLGSLIDQIPPSLNQSRLCEQAILGWRKYVAPHTPPESDLASHNFPPDNIFNAVTHLMLQTANVTAHNGRGVIPHIRHLIGIWPTVWIWIRLAQALVNHLPEGTDSGARLETKRNWHNAAIHALAFFLGFRLEQNPVFDELTTRVKETDGVLQMMATSWIQEAEDQHAAGFPSSRIHQISNPETISEFEQLVLARCGGSEHKLASLAFRRIARNLHLSLPNNLHVYEQLADDMLYIHNSIWEPSATMYAAFTTHSGWVTFFVDVMFCLLSPRHLLHMPLYSALFSSAMEFISMRIDEFQCYTEVRELLDCTPFLDVIARGSLAIRSAYDQLDLDVFNSHCDLVIDFIYQFAVHRPVLSRIDRDLAGISAFLERKATPAAISLLDVRSKIVPFVEIYKTFTTSAPPIFCCGNREVFRISSSSNDVTHGLISVTPMTKKGLCIAALAENSCFIAAMAARNATGEVITKLLAVI
ncbi:hypothetical protein FIBSPDRAFT_1042232 [Athelia psychrophila]|uniref:Uncharacterized protein n=1 Tax=Athelia psychrophila TaxID=1759441 RepID=A0A166MYY8_9AGAM|nr:hypothetical protein FIBSPDRAFT_1042232 [Fibularhizoctonia sp. CBS 109695]